MDLNYFGRGQKDSTVCRVFALHTADPEPDQV